MPPPLAVPWVAVKLRLNAADYAFLQRTLEPGTVNAHIRALVEAWCERERRRKGVDIDNFPDVKSSSRFP